MLKPGTRWRALPLVLLLVTCGEDGGPAAPTDNDIDNDGILNSVDDCPTQPETVNGWLDSDGCPDDTFDFYAAVRADAEGFWQVVFAQEGDVYQPISGLTAYSEPIFTACGVLVLNNAVYCVATFDVFYHREFLDSFLLEIGDVAPAIIVAHEIGHHVSNLLGLFLLRDLGLVTTKQLELQADCWAGAWVAFVANRGLLEEGDLEEAGATLFAVGDINVPWFNPLGHGTGEERVVAFALGFIDGVDGCADINVFPGFSKTNGVPDFPH